LVSDFSAKKRCSPAEKMNASPQSRQVSVRSSYTLSVPSSRTRDRDRDRDAGERRPGRWDVRREAARARSVPPGRNCPGKILFGRIRARSRDLRAIPATTAPNSSDPRISASLERAFPPPDADGISRVLPYQTIRLSEDEIQAFVRPKPGRMPGRSAAIAPP
jgi:hypothetical protein